MIFGYAQIVLGVSERRRAGGLGKERFGVGARELKLSLRRADPVVRMSIAELHKAVKIHMRASLDEGCKPAGREARRAEPVEVEMGAERRIAFHPVQRDREVARPFPGENGAGDRHGVTTIVAGMVDGDHDIAMPRQSRSKPRHDPRGAAKSVRKQDHRARAGVLEGGVRRG